tara:strand:- start:515 stop:655 length:141 start_codon:yes stop_codon:yes gene_type:complete
MIKIKKVNSEIIPSGLRLTFRGNEYYQIYLTADKRGLDKIMELVKE